MNYLLLNKNDITEVCGVVSRKELLKEMTDGQLRHLVSFGRPYKDKYILVEEEFNEKEKDSFDTVKVGETGRGIYYATSDGKFFVIYKKSKKRKDLHPYLKKKKSGKADLVVTLGSSKGVLCKSVIAKAFIREYNDGDVVLLKDENIYNVAVSNLIVVPKAVYSKMTGPMSRSKAVGLFEDGVVVKKWSSARKCAKDLFCSYQMIMDICNNAYPYTKGKEYDVRWI